MGRIMAVSYTHLDVYKRQGHENQHVIFPQIKGAFVDHPVSYTHLCEKFGKNHVDHEAPAGSDRTGAEGGYHQA